jgi:hypothetical protein
MLCSVRKPLVQSLLLFASFTLAACGGGGDSIQLSPTVPSATVSGVAATGAPINGGAVTLRCGGGATANTTSAADGRWTTSLPSAALPCAVRVAGGTVDGVANTAVFYSLARAASGGASTANLTPISDLALAAAVNSALGTALETWYASATDAQRQQVVDGLNTAIAALRAALIEAGYTLPAGEGFDPFVAAITAGAAEDLYDQLLEAYKQALAALELGYEAARGDYTSGAGLPPAPEAPNPPDTSLGAGESGLRYATTGTVMGGAESNQLRYWPGVGSVNVGSTAGQLDEVTLNGPEANSYVNFRNLPDTVGTHACGYGFNDNKANIELGFAVSNGYNSMGTRGADGSYTAGFRCSITITKVGSRNGSNYEGTIEGSIDAQLYKTGQAVNLPDSISVKGNFRLGTPATTEPEPVAGKSLLGAMLKNVIAGDYVLKCSASPGQAVQSFNFSVAQDGSSVFNGAPLVDATHPGTVKSDGDQNSFITLAFTPSAANSDYVVLGFKKDGSFYPNSVHVGGATLTCYSNTGHTAPAGSAQAVAALPGVAGALARTETLNCTQAGSTTPQTLTISSDGSAQIGSQSFSAAKLFTVTDGLLFATNKKGTLSYADTSGGAFRSLAIDFDADLKTTGVLASVGLGPNDGITCLP